MEIKDFFNRFAVYLGLAGAFWLLIVFAVERLMPGSIVPFLNLPFAGLLVFIFCAAAAVLGKSSEKPIWALIVGLIILAASMLWFWTRVSGLGLLGIGLEAAGVMLGLVLVFFLYKNQE